MIYRYYYKLVGNYTDGTPRYVEIDVFEYQRAVDAGIVAGEFSMNRHTEKNDIIECIFIELKPEKNEPND